MIKVQLDQAGMKGLQNIEKPFLQNYFSKLQESKKQPSKENTWKAKKQCGREVFSAC
ncbi:hypothetical protein TTHERM_00538540 (macronuclear) [Tetrahymena thermophila SB210]|uniref:Uncharacterized protein n=1 Tax=Tetrahymena thermophila (strain SB210) TaxID=312017 RepID=I7MDH8_TETTS|nr:hypothetical protein TTHERM_00538540 [Tetrahymena thermophila SB210]EAR87634.1 hypothetical protein TTHERM_00538540 [Tetrahymena thermophila SB210]|eukprot:XP_001007879.1 hypothetical protein TTHERM_00538540 [Tetrahymena thermophila SB210]